MPRDRKKDPEGFNFPMCFLEALAKVREKRPRRGGVEVLDQRKSIQSKRRAKAGLVQCVNKWGENLNPLEKLTGGLRKKVLSVRKNKRHRAGLGMKKRWGGLRRGKKKPAIGENRGNNPNRSKKRRHRT